MPKLIPKYVELLDKMLLYIKENSALSAGEVHTIQFDKIPESLRLQVLRHIQNEGYTFHEVSNKPNGGTIERLYLSIQGLTFLEKGGFSNQYNVERQKNNWRIAKTMAAAANAIIIILIGFYAIIVSNKTSKLETQVQALQDSLAKISRPIK